MKKYLLPGLLGFGISLLCLLPPIIHFLTGPLGPLIGGFVGGLQTRAKLKDAFLIGLSIGIYLTVFFIVIVSLIISLQISMPDTMKKLVAADTLSATSVLLYSLIPLGWATLLGGIGAWLGGRKMREKES